MKKRQDLPCSNYEWYNTPMRYLARLQKYNNFTFWLALIAGNALLFLPMPIISGRWKEIQNCPCQIGLEWLLLVALWVNLPRLWSQRGKNIFRWASFAVLSIFVAYQAYEAVDVGIYHNAPNFYNDWEFIGGGIGFVVDSLRLPWWEYLAGLLGFIATVGVVYFISTAHIRITPQKLSPFTRRATLMLALVALGYTFAFPQKAGSPDGIVASLSLKIKANIHQAALTRERVQAMRLVSPYKVYDYHRYTLAEHPNVYLFFLESYGSVLLKDPYFREQYFKLMQKVQNELESAGWYTASGLSISPVWGGGSWMAYTSALCGLRISQQPQYLALKYGFQKTPYPHLGRYMQSQGYRFTWVVPIDRELSPYTWEANKRFYGADVWLTFKDLHYHGPEYSWGPSPPDQYTLGFLRDWLSKQPSKPNFVFFLTQNTHYYFAPVPPIAKNWREINDPNFDDPASHPKLSSSEAYMKAIKYDWTVLADFIRSAGKDDVFILVGDHQPPLVSAPQDGYATIMHVISHDRKFVDSFLTYGLQEGMLPDENTPPLRHEGLYSLIVRQMVARWGQNPTILPKYYPRGIQIPGILPKVRSIYHKSQKFKPKPTESK